MKKTGLVVAIVTVLALGIATPFAYKAIKDYSTEKQLKENYRQFIDTNTTFFDTSLLNGKDISGKTTTEVAAEFEKEFNEQSVTIESIRTKDTNTYSYSSLNTDFSSFEKYLENCLANQKMSYEEYTHRAESLPRNYEYDLNKDIHFDNADFSQIAYFDDTVYAGPVNAYVYVDVTTGETGIIDAANGALADETTVTAKLISAITEGKDKLLLEDEDYVAPAITKDDPSLVDVEKYYNTLLNKNITLGVCGLTEYMDSATIRSFLKFDNELIVDTEALSKYVDRLKNNYDSYNRIYTFNTSMGYPVNLDYGNYGWTINKENTVSALTRAILKNEAEGTAECEYDHTCSRPTNNLQGDSYFEVSLTYQKVWLYIDGQLIVYDDCTTGDINEPASATFPGFFHVAQKTTECYLKGPTWYDFVHYWVLFDDPHANGFHDATWRQPEEFGGENRNGNGSHGCVNLRLETAATVFNAITFDMPVIIWQ